jgi:hypothetical protein
MTQNINYIIKCCQIESSGVQELLESLDEVLTETDLKDNPLRKRLQKAMENLTFNLKNLSEGLRMANKLCDFFMKIDPSMERSLIFKKQIANTTAEY